MSRSPETSLPVYLTKYEFKRKTQIFKGFFFQRLRLRYTELLRKTHKMQYGVQLYEYLL